MRGRRRTEHSRHVELFKSIQQLGIKTDLSKNDLDQLDKLLNIVLNYPSLGAALTHHNANSLGKNDLFTEQQRKDKIARSQKNQIIQSCPCCGVLANNERLSYLTKVKRLNLGVGPKLFYDNYIFHVILFCLMFIKYSVFAITTNLQVNEQHIHEFILCPQASCGVSQFGAGPKIFQSTDEGVNRLSRTQSWIGVFFVMVMGICYWLKIIYCERFVLRAGKKRISASNFTLMLTNVPREYFIDYIKQKKRVKQGKKSTQQILQNLKNESNWITKSAFEERASNLCYLSNTEIVRKFNKQFANYGRVVGSTVSYEVIKVNVAKPLYPLTRIMKKQQKKMRKKLQIKLDFFRNLVKERQNSEQFTTPQEKRNEFYDDFMDFYGEQFERNIQREIDYSDNNVVFVTLRSSVARKQIEKRNKPHPIYDCFDLLEDNDFPIPGVKVCQAPQPEEIKWECVGFPTQRKRQRRAMTWVVSICLIGLSLALSIAIKLVDQESVSLNFAISFLISLVVTIINLGIQMIIAKISYYQNEYISSKQQSSIALKIAVAQLLNSIGVPIALTLISQVVEQFKTKRWLRNQGLGDDVFYIALLNMLVPLGTFVDPWHKFLKIQRWWYSKPDNRMHIQGQKQFNKLFGNYQFDIGYEYAYLIKTTIFSSFFVCMQPIIALFAPIGLLLYFLASKRNFLYHYCRPHFYGSNINIAVDMVLRLSLLAFAFGNLTVNDFIVYYQNYPRNGTTTANWIMAGLAIIWMVALALRRTIFFADTDIGEWDYFEKQMLLNSDYDRLNPQTKQSAIYEFRHYLKKLDEDRHEIQDLPTATSLKMNGSKSIQDKRIESENKMKITETETQQQPKLLPMLQLAGRRKGKKKSVKFNLQDSPT